MVIDALEAQRHRPARARHGRSAATMGRAQPLGRGHRSGRGTL